MKHRTKGPTLFPTEERQGGKVRGPSSSFRDPRIEHDHRLDGETATKADEVRLAGTLGRVFEIMQTGRWRTIRAIALELERRHELGVSEATISARLRDFRKKRYGEHLVERRMSPAGGGTREYRLLVRVGGGS